jgi:hypothetical protein
LQIIFSRSPSRTKLKPRRILSIRLEALGWTEYQVQQILSQKGRKQVPDALLFADTIAKNLAVGEAQQWKRFQHGLAVLEAKRWSRALDRADKKDPSEEGVPSTQMLQYLSRVDVQTNNKVRLGILTNGNVSIAMVSFDVQASLVIVEP